MDNLDRSYKLLKRSTGLFTFTLLMVIIGKPLLIYLKLNALADFLIGIPILLSGGISFVGLIYALKGSQFGQRNPKKRFLALFGNLIFAALILSILISVFLDFKKLL